jgi:hypothetical protein
MLIIGRPLSNAKRLAVYSLIPPEIRYAYILAQ